MAAPRSIASVTGLDLSPPPGIRRLRKNRYRITHFRSPSHFLYQGGSNSQGDYLLVIFKFKISTDRELALTQPNFISLPFNSESIGASLLCKLA